MKKLLSLLLVGVALVGLTACGGDDTGSDNEGVSIDDVEYTDTYYDSYNVHYDTLNYLTSSTGSDLEIFANMVEGLCSYDNFGRIVGNGATSWENKLNADGTQTWTFHLREDNYWYTNDTLEKVAPVVADDYVAALEYILNPANASNTSGIVGLFINNAGQYAGSFVDGVPTMDFSEVGVKAVDDYTLEYTLPMEMPYFPTALSYSCFMPVNRDFLTNEGQSFGLSGDDLLVNGPYHLTLDTKDAEMQLEANPNYWGADDVSIQTIHYTFIPADAGADWARLKYENGELSGFNVTENDDTGYAKYVTGEDGTGTPENPASAKVYTAELTDPYSWGYMINPFRYYNNPETAYSLTNHETEADKINTSNALMNNAFRQAWTRAVDRSTFNAYFTPQAPDQRTRNTYMPAELAYDANGRDYVEYYADVKAREQNMSFEDALASLADGQDSWNDDTLAAQLFAQAKEELGDTVTWPVNLDLLWVPSDERYIYTKAYIDEITDAFGEYVNCTFLEEPSQDVWRNALYAGSYDINANMVGWGPDYADPLTYANTFSLDSFDFSVYYGLDFDYIAAHPESEAALEAVLGDYTQMVRDASAITSEDETEARMAAFAEAEYYFLNDVAIWTCGESASGSQLTVSNIVPLSMPQVTFGSNKYMYKWRKCIKGDLTQDLRDAFIAEHDAEAAKLAE